MNFVAGDVVKHKSGKGPKMVVVFTEISATPVWCQYWNDPIQLFQQFAFAAEVLKKV